MFEPRVYREKVNKERFQSVTVTVEETDLWIGCDCIADERDFVQKVESKIKELRGEISKAIAENEDFRFSHSPIAMKSDVAIVNSMLSAGIAAKTGPMAAVAGAVAGYVGKYIADEFDCNEVIIENGGDIYVKIENEMIFSAFAGDSPISEKVKFRIPANTSAGICTSAGTIGHSISYGKADAVTVICDDCSFADAYATAIANKVKTKDDIEQQLNAYHDNEDIKGLCIIIGDAVGYQGDFDLIF